MHTPLERMCNVNNQRSGGRDSLGQLIFDIYRFFMYHNCYKYYKNFKFLFFIFQKGLFYA